MRPRVSAVLLRRLRQSPTLVWAPLRLLPLVVNTAYLAVLHGTMTPTGTVALTEGKQTQPRLALRSDSEGELGEGRRESMPWINTKAELVVAAAEILDKGVSGADYSC